VNTTGWLKGLRVTGGGTEVVSHAGVALVRALSDAVGLTGGLSKALATDRLVVHDRGRVLADLACAIVDGGEGDQRFPGDWRPAGAVRRWSSSASRALGDSTRRSHSPAPTVSK